MRIVIHSLAIASLICLSGLSGCGRDTEQSWPDSPMAANVDASSYLAKVRPEGAVSVIVARSQSKDKEGIVITGRIGGSVDPWVEGLAAFSLVDLSLRACSDMPEDDCETPWDYCCEAELPKARVLVKFVDQSNQVVKTDARQLFGVKELQTVVVSGKAKRDASDNLTILADSLFVVNQNVE